MIIKPALRPPSAPPPVAATIHIYRGLMDRAATWRLRIDNPTNWAIVTSGTAVSFTLSDETHPHAVLLLLMLFVIMFLIIEARRTRYYDLWSSWLRLLETEYLAPILSIRIVDSLDEAIDHIAKYGSQHTDAIVTNDHAAAMRFLREVDSSSVMVNASTRFADGFEFGLGAEIGISTNKLHARGPVGLEGLTSRKWIVLGTGQVRT